MLCGGSTAGSMDIVCFSMLSSEAHKVQNSSGPSSIQLAFSFLSIHISSLGYSSI
jgi:hypothetical protein